MFSTITNAFNQGGIWMWSILAVQIVSIAIIIERVLSLYIFRKPNQKHLVRHFEADIKTGNIKQAHDRASSLGSSNPVGAVTQAGTQAALDMGGKKEVQSRMDEILLEENSRLDRRTSFLAMLGNVGTLLGLLGTIVGLIKAFSSVGNLNPIEKAAALSQGVSMAMTTTAYGLLMAIPALVMYAILQNRANILAEDLNQSSLRIFNWLTYSFDNPSQRKKAN